ncbi:hypothetical protein V8C86DRAFT_2724264 [Haematococcus lacustris]
MALLVTQRQGPCTALLMAATAVEADAGAEGVTAPTTGCVDLRLGCVGCGTGAGGSTLTTVMLPTVACPVPAAISTSLLRPAHLLLLLLLLATLLLPTAEVGSVDVTVVVLVAAAVGEARVCTVTQGALRGPTTMVLSPVLLLRCMRPLVLIVSKASGRGSWDRRCCPALAPWTCSLCVFLEEAAPASVAAVTGTMTCRGTQAFACSCGLCGAASHKDEWLAHSLAQQSSPSRVVKEYGVGRAAVRRHACQASATRTTAMSED